MADAPATAATPTAPTFPPTGNPLIDVLYAMHRQTNQMMSDSFQQMLDRNKIFNDGLAGMETELVKEITAEASQ